MCESVQIVHAGTTVTVLARLVGIDQTPATQASLATILRSVVAVDTGAVIVEEEELGKADVVFNALQTDWGWDVDDIGYNLRDTINGTAFDGYVGLMRVVYTITDADGHQIVAAVTVTATEV